MLSVLATHTKEHKETEMMDMFITWIVGIVTWVYTHVQTHQIVYINHKQFSVYQLHLNKELVRPWLYKEF